MSRTESEFKGCGLKQKKVESTLGRLRRRLIGHNLRMPHKPPHTPKDNKISTAVESARQDARMRHMEEKYSERLKESWDLIGTKLERYAKRGESGNRLCVVFNTLSRGKML